MHAFPEIDAYFITHSPTIESTRIEGDTIFVPGEERLDTLLHKTIESIRFCTRTTQYDFILRTNLSSVWFFKRFLEHLTTIPTHSVYAGFCGWYTETLTYASGSGILMSLDVAKLLCENSELAYTFPYLDDVAIGATFQKLRVRVHHLLPRYDILVTPRSVVHVPDSHFHIRIKLVDDRMNEPGIMCWLLSQAQ
jgi:hypothetical protein